MSKDKEAKKYIGCIQAAIENKKEEEKSQTYTMLLSMLTAIFLFTHQMQV